MRITNLACEKRPDVLVISAGQDRNMGLVSLRRCFVELLLFELIKC